jgi:hypothetical protein
MKNPFKKKSELESKQLEKDKNSTRPSVFNNGQPLSETQWETINNSLSNYWKERIEIKSEETITFDVINNIPINNEGTLNKIKNQSTLIEIIHNSGIEECLNILPIMLDFNDLEAITQTEIINEIRTAYYDDLSGAQLASNLYWKYHTINEDDRVVRGLKNKKIYGTVFNDDSGSLKIRLDEPLKSTNETIIDLRGGYKKTVDPSLHLNWNFIASNALGYIHSNIKMLEYEELSVHSAIYFVYHAGTPCEWCNIHSGEIVRLLPRTVIDNNIDALSHYSINDPYTETAIWFNKNNIDHEQSRICAYPHIEEDYTCHFELQPIDFDKQEYDPKLKRVVDKVPESLRRYGIKRDTSFATPEYKESIKPTKIGDNLVRFNNNIYEAVPKEDFKRKNELYQKDRTLPLPIPIGTPQYKRIFGEADKRREKGK